MRYYDYQHYYYYYTGRNYFSLLTTSEPGCKAGFWLPTWLHIRRKSTDSEPSYQLLITQCQVRHIRLPWGKNRSHPFTWTDRNSCYWRGFRLGSWVWLYTMTQTVAWFSSVVHSGPFWPPPQPRTTTTWLPSLLFQTGCYSFIPLLYYRLCYGLMNHKISKGVCCGAM